MRLLRNFVADGNGLAAIVGPESLWRNEFAARLMLRFPFYRPVRTARRLTMPVLVCVCDSDTTAPPGSTRPSCTGWR